MAGDGGARLKRTELIAFGKDLVRLRLEHLGCTVAPARDLRDGRLRVRTGSGRGLEVFVATQRVGGYACWTKLRLQPAVTRFAAIALVDDVAKPALYVVPSVDWLHASPPLTDRDYVGKASKPEYGIVLGPSALHALDRYRWSDAAARKHFG